MDDESDVDVAAIVECPREELPRTFARLNEKEFSYMLDAKWREYMLLALGLAIQKISHRLS